MSCRPLFIDHTGKLGGAELSLLDVTQSVEDAQVILFEHGPFYERLQEQGIPVDVYPAAESLQDVSRSGSIPDDLMALPHVARLAGRLARRARDFDVIYANSQKSMVVGALAAMMARRPLIWHLRDLLTTEHFSKWHCRLTTWVANFCATHVIANSRATGEAFRAHGGTAPMSVIWNGIDPAPFEAVTSGEVERLKRQLGLDDVPLVGVFSRIAQWKGQHVLLEALADLPDVHALIAGGTLFQGDERYKEALHRMAREYELEDRLHFLGFRDDIPRLMHLVDVVLHTSVAPEPFGRVIVEGMLSGKPVVASRAGGATEILDPPRTGLLVPPGDAGVLTTALQRLYQHPHQAAEMGQQAKQHALRHFSVTRMQRAVRDLLSTVVSDD
jgi:glycosyltransferase involved in cell wall biosynthesis